MDRLFQDKEDQWMVVYDNKPRYLFTVRASTSINDDGKWGESDWSNAGHGNGGSLVDAGKCGGSERGGGNFVVWYFWTWQCSISHLVTICHENGNISLWHVVVEMVEVTLVGDNSFTAKIESVVQLVSARIKCLRYKHRASHKMQYPQVDHDWGPLRLMM